MAKPDPEQLAELRAWARRHGRKWKAPLRHAWETGDYGGFENYGPLQRVRNQFGPSWLVRFRFPKEGK